MKKQGVIANIQPPFVPSDGSWLGKILPDKLIPYAYAWKSLIDEGMSTKHKHLILAQNIHVIIHLKVFFRNSLYRDLLCWWVRCSR